MSSDAFTILAYGVVAAIILGYFTYLWLAARRLASREGRR